MKYLIKISLLSLKNKIISLKLSDDFKAAIFIFIGINLGIIIYAASFAFFKYINSIALAGPLIVNKLISLIFLMAFIMTILSSLLISFSTIFFSKDIKWLLHSPIKTSTVFSYKALSTALYASWMVFVMLIPFILALGAAKQAKFYFYPGAIFFTIPLLFGASFLGSIFSLILMHFFPKAKIRNIIFIAAGVLFTLLLLILRLAQPEKLISSQGFEVLSQYLGYLDSPTLKFLPSWWYTSAVLGLIGQNIKKVILCFSMLIGSMLFLWIVLKYLAKKFFLNSINEGQIYASMNIKKDKFIKRSPIIAIFQKDIKVFVRDSNQWSQVLILASIVIVYLFSIYKLSFETLKMHNIMTLVNCALVWFVSTAIALRLSFPLISLEGESFWFLLTRPISKMKLFIEKILFGSIPVFIMAMILIIATNYMMDISKPVFIASIVSTASISILISCAAVSIGAVLPKFNYVNIPQIESSLGGIVFMLFTFFIIIVNIIILMQPVKLFYSNTYTNSLFVNYILFLVLFNLFLYVMIFTIGYNAFKRIER